MDKEFKEVEKIVEANEDDRYKIRKANGIVVVSHPSQIKSKPWKVLFEEKSNTDLDFKGIKSE